MAVSGNGDPSPRLFFGLDALDDHAIVQRTELHDFLLVVSFHVGGSLPLRGKRRKQVFSFKPFGKKSALVPFEC